MPKFPQRTETHITDTRALRLVIRHMPDQLLIRSLEERDYGIDMQLEHFNGANPTGQLALVQVKGTKNEFVDGIVKLSFPVKTIEYAKLFEIPFFVFHTSVTTEETRFIWLQSYTSVVLDVENSRWRTQEEVTLNFPPGNVLSESGWERLKLFIGEQSVRQQHIELMKIENELHRFGHLALDCEQYSRETCIRAAQRLPSLTNLLLERGFTSEQLDSWSLGLIQGFKSAQTMSSQERECAQRLLKDVLESLDTPIMEFLAQDNNNRAIYGLGVNDNPF